MVFGGDTSHIHTFPLLSLLPVCLFLFPALAYSLVSSVLHQDLIHVLLSRLNQGSHQMNGSVASLLAAAHHTSVLNAHRLQTQPIIPVEQDSIDKVVWVVPVYSPSSVYGESG